MKVEIMLKRPNSQNALKTNNNNKKKNQLGLVGAAKTPGPRRSSVATGVNGCGGESVPFRMWSLRCCPCFGGWGHTHAHTVSTKDSVGLN